MKTCKICKEERYDWEFSMFFDGGIRYIANICKKCEYAIMKTQWKLILESQDGKCKFCGKKIDGDVCVDCDCKTMIIRGLLCSDCNIVLSHIDDLEWRERAIDYIKNANALEELK